ncbi:MAG: SDR family oxidoreductase [Ilumatobacteraceae bacterium]
MVAGCLDSDVDAATRLDLVDPFIIYSSTKRALARWIRRQAPTANWAGQDIALNAVAPGIIRTPMTAGMLANETVRERLATAVPMPYGGIAEPVVVAQALAFLSSPLAQSITGQTLFVDGGGDCVVRGDDVF